MNPYLPSLADFAEPWHTDAACRSHPNPDLWHPDPGDNTSRHLALAICRKCPALEACLKSALDREGDLGGNARQGIWGGLTPHRRAIRAGALAATDAPDDDRRDQCPQGHDRDTHGILQNRTDRGRPVRYWRCLTCQQELQDLHREAARILGLTQKEYRSAHGTRRATAEAIIAQHERTTS